MSIKLYPHNQETYNKICESWKVKNKVAVVQATGTGKSFLILKCLFDKPNENKIVLAPTEYIFQQLIEHSDEVIPNVQFITYAKIANMSLQEIEDLNPSLIILDEFHRCGAEQWGKGIQNLLNTFTDSKVLGTSATPIRYLDNERDMSDELFDGNVVTNLSLAEAIVKGILPMPKYISALYTLDEEVDNLKKKVNNSNNSDEEKEEFMRQIDVLKNKLDKSKGIPNILKKYLTSNNGKFIIFCKSKEHLNEMKEVVVEWFRGVQLGKKIETYTVYNKYKDSEKEFELFRDNKDKTTINLLFSIEMLNEGVHVEDIDGVILLRPTISPIIYYQQIGRAIDAGSDKEPLIFDFVNNFNNIGAKQFIEDLQDFRKREIYARKEYEDKNDIDIPEFVIYDEILEVRELFNSIENKLIDNWDNMFEQLKDYYMQYGNCNISQRNGKLGMWISHQRQYYYKNILSNDRIEKLESIGFIWDIIEYKWYSMYELLKNTSNFFNDKTLSIWVGEQRKKYKKNLLEIKKVELLNQINFTWYAFDESWEAMYLLLIEYINENSHCLVPAQFIYKKKRLGYWVGTQRKTYKNNLLSSEKIEKLNKLGFIWNADDYVWNIMYQELLNFKKNNNNKNVPKNYMVNGKKLNSWVYNQQMLIKTNKISKERKDKLNNIELNYNKMEDINISKYHIKNLLINSTIDTKTLSKLLNISVSSIGMWKIGKANIPQKYLQDISNIFNIDINLIEPQKRL